INWRLSDEPVGPSTDEDHVDPAFRASTRCMIFLGFTSNLTSAGVREHIRYLAQHRMEQKEDGVNWTPSKLIDRLGKEINHPDSIYYWAHKNGIPVFSPAITDGSIGDMLYFHSYKNPGLRVDMVEDIRRINDIAMRASPRKTGMIILGGGVPKHHIANANLMRNGADFAVYLNTAQEFDGSDSGARPDEAVSWGKIRMDAKPVKVSGDATILFPLLISQTFARYWQPVDLPSAQPGDDKGAAAGKGV
ncbi:Deoxyhypusine synthase, partial [Tetrabaena socialis]